MMAKAPRDLAHLWHCRARGALLVLLTGVLLVGASVASAERITAAQFEAPTDRYPHGVLGDDLEWGALRITTEDTGAAERRQYRITLSESRVFEDLTPRVVDLDGDGAPEVVVVESDARRGAQLAIYDQSGKIAATPFIGTRFRWLAPIGAADLDGDGAYEIAYIDRPHLAKTLRVWRFEREDGKATLSEIASKPGLTNHRIGQDFITSGIRDCGDGPEMITVDAGWKTVMATRFSGGELMSRKIAPFISTDAIQSVLSCQE